MDAHITSRRPRRHGEFRLLEKQMRPEVVERCLQFIDVVVNQIIFQENIYPSDLFLPRQMYRLLVHQCVDKDISSYITLCVASLRDLFAHQLSDMISINIVRNAPMTIVLRRYLIELHTIHDPCLRAIYDNTKQLINQLEQIFAQCIRTIQQIKPLDNPNQSKGWTFQFRSCPDGRNVKGVSMGEILRKKPIHKEFVLTNQQAELLSNGKQSKISSIKSLHSERLKLQFMCEDDKYEQEKFQQWNQYLLDKTLTDEGDMDSDTDELQESEEETDMSSSSSRLPNGSELWPLTTMNNPPECTFDEPDVIFEDVEDKVDDKQRKKTMNIDSDSLVDRYHLTQRVNRDNFDTRQYSSDEDDRPQSPFSPDRVWQVQDEEDEEDF